MLGAMGIKTRSIAARHASRAALATALVSATTLAACSAVSPPPLIPMHGGTAPHAVDETTVTVVVGVAGELFGGDGWGLALRGEQQVRDGTALGVQIGGGRGTEGERDEGRELRHWLVEVRGYGRVVAVAHDWGAVLASAGVTAMDTGMVATTLAVGGALSIPNDYAVPALGVFGAVSVPWRRGRGFGPHEDKYVHTTWWLGASLGLQVPIPDTRNAPSIEIGMAVPANRGNAGQLSLSLADSHHF